MQNSMWYTAWTRTPGSRWAFQRATCVRASRRHAAEPPEGTYAQQWTIKSSVNRAWHRGEYKTLEKDMGLHKGTSHSKSQWVNCSDFRKGHNSSGVTDRRDKALLQQTTPRDPWASSPYCSYQTTSGCPKAPSPLLCLLYSK